MNKIYLMGGAPTVGKTHTAQRLSKKLGVPWISTDSIRRTMRNYVNKKDYPHLFEEGNVLSAEEYLSRFTPSQIVANQNRESLDVWRGVENLINTEYVWESFIIEGVAVIPKLVKKLVKNKRIQPLFLVHKDENKIREVVYRRGLYSPADEYSDKYKEKEVIWASMLNEKIRQEATKFKLPLYEIKKWNYPVSDILKKYHD